MGVFHAVIADVAPSREQHGQTTPRGDPNLLTDPRLHVFCLPMGAELRPWVFAGGEAVTIPFGPFSLCRFLTPHSISTHTSRLPHPGGLHSILCIRRIDVSILPLNGTASLAFVALVCLHHLTLSIRDLLPGSGTVPGWSLPSALLPLLR
jgi:hypothetical protein